MAVEFEAEDSVQAGPGLKTPRQDGGRQDRRIRSCVPGFELSAQGRNGSLSMGNAAKIGASVRRTAKIWTRLPSMLPDIWISSPGTARMTGIATPGFR